jgi:uncharacterized coiled-coil protein SlyX
MDDFQEIIDLFNKSKEVIISQRSVITMQSETVITLTEALDLKDQTIDKQSQMLQLLELKLKDLGFSLGESDLLI